MVRAAYSLVVGISSVLTAAAPALHAPVLRLRQTNETAGLTFADILPSSEINWVDCYKAKFQCSYLTVPLDYENITAGTTDVAFVRYLVNKNAEDLLINPGGPGVSGIEFVLGSGPSYAKAWGYNPVGFDPRGVGWTKPTIACKYGGDNSTTLRRRGKLDALGNMTEVWNTSLQTNHACTVANDHTDAKYVGTSAVVQDLMHFTELQASAKGRQPSKALINFYGISYGTLIGQTLVALYPDRIRRVLLDGNVYGVAHYQGWEPSGLDDLAHGIWLFSKLCYEAGEDWCVLAHGANSIDEVHARFDTAVEKLRLSPEIDASGTSLDDTAFLSLIQSFMYSPSSVVEGFATLANATLHVLERNSTSAKLFKRDDHPKTSADALAIITAVDIAGRYPWSTYEEWKAATEKLETTAPYGAKGYASSNGIIGLAAGILPPNSQYFPGFKKITPRAKVLFVNTAGDPVTPRSSAQQMSKLFVGSGVLIVNGPGHGYQSAPSKCASTLIARYFANGTVPTQETWCEPDVEAKYYFGGGVA